MAEAAIPATPITAAPPPGIVVRIVIRPIIVRPVARSVIVRRVADRLRAISAGTERECERKREQRQAKGTQNHPLDMGAGVARLKNAVTDHRRCRRLHCMPLPLMLNSDTCQAPSGLVV